jgi:hypothetical protein
MRRIFIAVTVAMVATLLVARTCCAENSRRIGVAIFGGYGTYSMSDVNDAITSSGTLVPGTSLVSADEISGGATFGGGLRFTRSDRVTLAIDVSRLLAKTTGTAVFLGTPYDIDLTVPATNVALTVQYLFGSTSSTRLGLGLGGGYYVCTGELDATNGGLSESADLHGSGFGLHGLFIGDLALSKTVHVEMGAGYRYARTSDIDVEGGVLHNPDGSNTTVDWSGFMGKIGTTLYFGTTPTASRSE